LKKIARSAAWFAISFDTISSLSPQRKNPRKSGGRTGIRTPDPLIIGSTEAYINQWVRGAADN
jgi:hypothetical protein